MSNQRFSMLLPLLLILPIIGTVHSVSVANSTVDDDNVITDDDNGFMSYNDCGLGNLLRLKVDGCEPKEERRTGFCWLTRGSDPSLVAKFIAQENYERAYTDVRIKIGFLEFGYPPIEYDACAHYLKCPLTKHAISVARVTFPVPSLSPRFTSMLITARLYGPNGELIVCGSAKAGLL